MAKPQQKRKARPSWFQKQVDQFGQDFLDRKQPKDIQRDAMNIVRDMVRGNISNRDFPYLFDLKVLSNVRFVVYEKYIEIYTYDAALTYAMQSPQGPQILETYHNVAPDNLQKYFNKTKNDVIAYGAILTALDNMIAFVQSPYPKTLEDYMQFYQTLLYQISRFKYII